MLRDKCYCVIFVPSCLTKIPLISHFSLKTEKKYYSIAVFISQAPSWCIYLTTRHIPFLRLTPYYAKIVLSVFLPLITVVRDWQTNPSLQTHSSLSVLSISVDRTWLLYAAWGKYGAHILHPKQSEIAPKNWWLSWFFQEFFLLYQINTGVSDTLNYYLSVKENYPLDPCFSN